MGRTGSLTARASPWLDMLGSLPAGRGSALERGRCHVADQRRKVGSVTYREAAQDYFDKRGLRRHAGVWSLWALGVAAVISGDFSGWNFGIGVGGFGGLLIATIVITVMYLGLAYSIAEMSPALPHTGGAYSFGRSAMGPWGGFITGLAENLEYVLTPAVVVFFAGAYAQQIFIDLFDVNLAQPYWWLIFYVIFVALNIVGIEATMRFTVFICFASLAVLAVFFVSAIPKFDASLLTNIPPEGDNSSFLPFGISGIFKALPFAIWFYLAIEELPLAAEESMDPKRDVPKGTIYGMLTLIVTGFLVLFLNTGVEPGAAHYGGAAEPLLDGFRTTLGSDTAAALLGLFALTGLIASFHTIIFAYGRNIFSLSRAGYFPHWMSVTHGQRRTPWVALLLGGAVGYGLATLVYHVGFDEEGATTDVGDALLTMAVFGAVISYFMQMLSFVFLRRRLPNIRRPYRSPLGEVGAIVAGIIALVSLISLYLIESYRPGVIGTAIWFVVGILYFGLSGRKRLVLSPEEEFAMTRGEHGHPQEEGYGTTRVEEVRTTDPTP
jgi:ethanolamine permease